MAAHNVKALCESTRSSLKEAVALMESFLNSTTIESLNPVAGEQTQEFYRDFLSDLRRLCVYTEDGYEKLGVALRRKTFPVDYAEKVLHEVFHQCVNQFFFPKHECYSEEGRYAYTGQDAIRFRKKPARAVRDITLQLSKIFEVLREELAYYETDYVTKRKMQEHQV